MLSRAVRRGFASAARHVSRQPFVPLAPRSPVIRPLLAQAARSVTTDAASSHAEREKVPLEDDKPFEVVLSDERSVVLASVLVLESGSLFCYSFETYELDPPSYYLDTTKQELKQMYYDMVSVRYVLVSCRLRLYIHSGNVKADAWIKVAWRWPQIGSTKKRRSEASVIFLQVKKL